MKLKEILNMTEYLRKECYCPGEIYSPDGFFFQIFKDDYECEVLGEIKEYNNSISKIPCKILISKSMQESVQILFVMYENEKIIDIIRVDATENNIKFVKEVLKNGKSDLKLNQYKEGSTQESLSKMLEIADAIMIN